MLIGGVEYKPQEAFNDVLTIPDCWVIATNKVGKGHGEGKFYYGSKTKLGEIFPLDCHEIKCVVLKSDLDQLMKNLKVEYYKPKEKYRGRAKFRELYEERLKMIANLPDEPIEFEIYYQAQIEGGRGYINTDSEIYKLLREICFPNICYLSIMRLVNTADAADIVYYWKIEIDYKLLYAKNRKDSYALRYGMAPVSKSERKGQTTYRNKLLKEFNHQCAVTHTDMPSLLVASHIMPWRSARDEEKTDPNNGILLSVLYDKLFDQGFITFDKSNRLQISTWLSMENIARLHVDDGVIAAIPHTPKREKYLDYHRNNIFKGIVK